MQVPSKILTTCHSFSIERDRIARLVHQILAVPTIINPGKRPAVGSRPGSIRVFDTVVQRWLLASDRDRTAVGLSFESPSLR